MKWYGNVCIDSGLRSATAAWAVCVLISQKAQDAISTDQEELEGGSSHKVYCLYLTETDIWSLTWIISRNFPLKHQLGYTDDSHMLHVFTRCIKHKNDTLSLIRTENQKEDNLLIIIYVENVGLFHELTFLWILAWSPPSCVLFTQPSVKSGLHNPVSGDLPTCKVQL